MAWSVTSTPCVTVHTTLVRQAQIDYRVQFTDAGALKMSDLVFFNTAASSDIVKAQALMLANTLDSIFTNTYLAVYQTGYDQDKSVAAMVTTMVVANNTVENLCDTIVECYNIT